MTTVLSDPDIRYFQALKEHLTHPAGYPDVWNQWEDLKCKSREYVKRYSEFVKQLKGEDVKKINSIYTGKDNAPDVLIMISPHIEFSPPSTVKVADDLFAFKLNITTDLEDFKKRLTGLIVTIELGNLLKGSCRYCPQL